MHFCTAQIAIGGDSGNIAYAGPFDPVSWPEILVLQEVHGGDAVTDVEALASVDISSRAERDRLAIKYGDAVVSKVFGGKQGPGEMEVPRGKVQDGTQWRNPITGDFETVGQASDPDAAILFEGISQEKPDPKTARRK